MNYWSNEYGFSQKGSLEINKNINIFYKLLSTINLDECVKDNHECEKIKKYLEKYK